MLQCLFKGFRAEVQLLHEKRRIVLSSQIEESIKTSIEVSMVVLSTSTLPDQSIKYDLPHFGIDLYSVPMAETFELVFYNISDASEFVAALHSMTGDDALNTFNKCIIQAALQEPTPREDLQVDQSIATGFEFKAEEEVRSISVVRSEHQLSQPVVAADPKKRQSFFSRMFGSSSSSSSSPPTVPLERSASFSSEAEVGVVGCGGVSSSRRSVDDDVDIEAYEEEMDDTASVSSFGGSSGSPRRERGPVSQLIADPTLKLNSTHKASLALIDISKNIKAIETQVKNMDDERKRDWEVHHKPIYRSQVAEISQVIKETQEKIDKEMYKGPLHIAEIEVRLAAYVDVLEDTKKKLYFPLSNIVIGGSGVYFAMDDFWIEHIKGYFELLLSPKGNPSADIAAERNPTVMINLTGSEPMTGEGDGLGGGVSVRLKVDFFKLNGDKGSGVPRLSLDSLKVTLTVRLSIVLDFDPATKRWSCNSTSGLKIKLLSFKGPYGLSRTLVATILTMVKPLIRRAISQAIPFELGNLLAHLPAPMSVRGDFSIDGMSLDTVSRPINKMTEVEDVLDISHIHSEMFLVLQKMFSKSPQLTTINDIAAYTSIKSKYPKLWTTLLLEWDKAFDIYQTAVGAERERISALDIPKITVSQIMNKCIDIKKKHINLELKIQHLKGSFDINHFAEQSHLLMLRLAEAKMKSLTEENLKAFQTKLGMGYEKTLEALKTISHNLDLVRCKLRCTVESGTKSYIVIAVDDLGFQAPLNLNVPFPVDTHFGYRPPVDFNIILDPMPDGTIQGEVDYLLKKSEFDDEFLAVDAHADKSGSAQFSSSKEEATESTTSCKYEIDARKRLQYRDGRGMLEGRWVPIIVFQLTKPIVSLIVDRDVSLRSGTVLMSAGVASPCTCQVSTESNVKLSTSIQQFKIGIDMVPFDDFIAANFTNLKELRTFISGAYRADLEEDLLQMVKSFYNIFAKHLVASKDIDIDLRIQGGIMVRGEHVIVSCDTLEVEPSTLAPGGIIEAIAPSASSEELSNLYRAFGALKSKERDRRKQCALKAQISVTLAGLYDDYCEFQTVFYNFWQLIAASSVRGSVQEGEPE